MVYKITTPEEGYTGIIAGVSFSNGEGETENSWLSDWFVENGYKVEKEEVAEDEYNMEAEETYSLSELSLRELKDLAKEKGIQGYSSLNKEELIKALEE